MKRSTLFWLLAGLGALALATTTGVVEVMADWKKKAQANAGALYDSLISMLHAAEDKYGIPRDLLARQAYQESRFRPDIIDGTTKSPAGAEGFMQIVPAYHPDVDPLDTPAAIDYAGKIMAGWYNQFGSWDLALAAYNAGPGNVKKYGNAVPPFTETQNYVAQIMGDVPTVSA